MTPPLGGRDERILRWLTATGDFDRVCDVGHQLRAWRPSDVVRVRDTWLNPPRPTEQTPTVRLSAMQAAVIDLALTGAGPQAIAQQLGVTESTVNRHYTRAVTALGYPNRAEALAAVKAGRVRVTVRDGRRVA